MVDYKDPTLRTTLVQVVQCGWSGQIGDLSNLRVSFLICFLHHTSRSHFLTNLGDLLTKMHVSCQGCAFWQSRQRLITFRGQSPKNSPTANK